ncbi:MAG: hypothetical protein AAFX08_07000 [Pseudomonadota bacterium]
MLFRVRDAIDRARFNAAAKGVLATPPLPVRADDDALTIVTMLQSKDVIPYLVAAKSFYARLNRGRIVIVDDGSLTPVDRQTLSAHLPGVVFRPMAEGAIDGLPRGGCWERLGVVAKETHNAYVIQLDADTVTLGDLSAVESHIDERSPFAIADGPVPGMRSLRELANYQRARTNAKSHVQLAVEHALDRVGLPDGRRYLRGSAAFAGYPKGSDIAQLMREFSDAMGAALGDQWSAWGTEQATSNYVVANIGEASALAPPAYANHTPETDIDAASLIHFYGEYRYVGGRYAAAARRAIERLRDQATNAAV